MGQVRDHGPLVDEEPPMTEYPSFRAGLPPRGSCADRQPRRSQWQGRGSRARRRPRGAGSASPPPQCGPRWHPVHLHDHGDGSSRGPEFLDDLGHQTALSLVAEEMPTSAISRLVKGCSDIETFGNRSPRPCAGHWNAHWTAEASLNWGFPCHMDSVRACRDLDDVVGELPSGPRG